MQLTGPELRAKLLELLTDEIGISAYNNRDVDRYLVWLIKTLIIHSENPGIKPILEDLQNDFPDYFNQ